MSKLDRKPGLVMKHRRLLKWVAWAAAGVAWTMRAGALSSAALPHPVQPAPAHAAPTYATAAPATRTVIIGNFAFSPAEIEVPAGTQVTWSNDDDIPHTIVATDGGPVTKSRPLVTAQKYAMVLNKPGTYRYFCSLHPHMTGTIVVR